MSFKISYYILTSTLILSYFFYFGQDGTPFQNKSMLILASTNNISEAFTIAKTAAKKTNLEFRDNKLEADKEIGATFPKNICEGDGFEFPCYVARGRNDDGTYITVEYSNGYDNFKKGLFIVIAASGNKNDADLKKVFKSVQSYYPTCYFKDVKIYSGCMH